MAFSKQFPYPSWRYHANLPAKVVNSDVEDAALGSGWADTPAAFLHGAHSAAAPAVKPSVAPKPAAAPVAPVNVLAEPVWPDTPAEPPAVDPLAIGQNTQRDEDEKQALWAAPVATVITMMAGSTKGALEKAKTFENANPKGPRASLIKALDAAIAASE